MWRQFNSPCLCVFFLQQAAVDAEDGGAVDGEAASVDGEDGGAVDGEAAFVDGEDVLLVSQAAPEEKNEDAEEMCERCGADNDVFVHAFGCVALCDGCGEGQCVGTSEFENCVRCSDAEDAEVRV